MNYRRDEKTPRRISVSESGLWYRRAKDRQRACLAESGFESVKTPHIVCRDESEKAAGLTMTITGYTIAGCLLIGGLITGVTERMLLGASRRIVALSIQVILLAVFTALGITGTKLLSRVAVSDLYRRATGQRI